MTSLRHLQILSKELETPKVLDEKQEQLLDWLLLPPRMRVPSTKADMAEVLGISYPTLKRWVNLPHFKAAHRKRVEDGIATPERVEEATRTAFELGFTGSDPDHRWAQIYITMAGLGKAENGPKTTAADAVADLSDEELDALLFEAAAAEKKRRQA